MTTNEIPAPEQRVRDYLDVTEERGDVIDGVGPNLLTSGDLRDVLAELDVLRGIVERVEELREANRGETFIGTTDLDRALAH